LQVSCRSSTHSGLPCLDSPRLAVCTSTPRAQVRRCACGRRGGLLDAGAGACCGGALVGPRGVRGWGAAPFSQPASQPAS
jgi:hypothetical protein